MDAERVDLAVIGAGAAGTYVADTMKQRRPDWSIALFERSTRIGGRLRSVTAPGLGHPVELGGMRFLTSHRRVASLVADFDLPTHPFNETGGTERSFLRGRFADGPSDPAGGSGYELDDHERGRSAVELSRDAFQRIVSTAPPLDAERFLRLRAMGRYGGRRLTDWSIGDAIATIRSREGQRYLTDAFGYDSGLRPFNAGDAIEFLLGVGSPTAEARVPDDGMDRIPRSLAKRFLAGGGSIHLDHQLESLDVASGGQRLQFANGAIVQATRTVVTIPVPALRLLATASPVLQAPAYARLLGAVEAFPAAKLYLWYERPWWRPGVPGIRMTTDLPPRKLFYFDTDPGTPAALLAAYTDGLDVAPWRDLWEGSPAGAPAPARMLEATQAFLRLLHPDVRDIPAPAGSSFVYWGADPHETGWTFWSAGAVSDDVMAAAVQPDPAVRVYLAGEAFSRSQSWVEGALETAELVAGRLQAS